MKFNLLDYDDFDKKMRNHVIDYIEKQRKINDFINTDEFKENFEVLRAYLKEHESFSTDGVYYTETEEEKKFADNAIQIFSTVDNNTRIHRNVPDSTFPTMEIAHDGIKMSVMMGQGSLFSFWLE